MDSMEMESFTSSEIEMRESTTVVDGDGTLWVLIGGMWCYIGADGEFNEADGRRRLPAGFGHIYFPLDEGAATFFDKYR